MLPPVHKRETVEQFILKEIADGRYEPGDLVATGAELARRLGVSLSTAGNALRRLKEHGVLHGALGSAGTRVAVPGQNPPRTTAERATHLAAVIRRQIEDGTYPSGTLLPSNRVLARAHRVPGHVVVQVIKILVDEELVETRASIGKLVRDPRERPGSRRLLSKSDQLVKSIRDDILNGALIPGEPLPSSIKLAHRYGMGQTTVVKSVPKLLAEGLIVKVPSMSGRFLIRQTRRKGPGES
ncbi:putative transcriptional regulator, GntR family [Streptomyces himastatinicus ATCC 53653]|uniref:Putative transcriptional regulator, GntR family n=1 Tax=Streptomyces himastatinicus ATCC 53653 TaxID=457427 RepID=D9WUP2_9ACTN|nr:GntR family transcriptional regulator [Streptomyces himastatinicus]EFL26424.1 putative transcriptional regulator, GntR family [Streptomyces himastatinicus ATCC 53653]